MKRVFILFLCCLAISIGVSYSFNFFNDHFFHFKASGNQDEEVPTFYILLLGPLLETVIFQYVVYNFLSYIKIKKDWICIILMSLIFSLVHYYSIFYVLMVFFSSLASHYFYITTLKKNAILSFFGTFLLHSMYNLFGYLFVV
ncbi:CPBP family glutamic-type intramembrane protease [Chryseobacterium sp.]|uniref:CPBP family glutamic-type intramembrane protease n=1 Tax=Chryseobacterium sp. TaxID=1871047 RepID=UPI0034251F8D|nr:CPBP family intramembrane metalloprotease [Chryseobacterium sp.]